MSLTVTAQAIIRVARRYAMAPATGLVRVAAAGTAMAVHAALAASTRRNTTGPNHGTDCTHPKTNHQDAKQLFFRQYHR